MLNRRAFIGTAIAAPLGIASAADDWVELFDGQSLNGWRPSENKDSWKAVDSMLAADGPRSHLFYNGPVRGADFRNFELEVELTTKPECNSGIYFHTAYQETGFPEKGFEIQINNTAKGDGGYLERKKTGSLYGIRNVYMQLVPDDKPFHVRVAVRGKNVRIHVNEQLVVDYVEPTPPVIPTGGEKQRYLDHGTFALQCHNDGSRASYKSVRVRPLPDNLPAYAEPAPVADQTYRDIINIGRHNIPMVDFHVFLRDGMTLEDALRKSRKDGIQYGITAEVKNDADAERWLRPLIGKPVFRALSGTSGLSRETALKFDYILGDGRQYPNASLEDAVDRVVKRLDSEPIDIYTYATDLEGQMTPEEIWTQPRMAKLIDALARNKVAIELNTLEQQPGADFIKLAKDAGCKFAFGTGNRTAAELKRCEYGLRMVESCQLDWRNFFAPGSWQPKAAERRWT